MNQNAILNAIEVLKAAAGAADVRVTSVQEAWDAYAAWVPTRRKPLRPRSWEAVQARMRPVLRAFADRPLSSLTQDDVLGYMDARVKEKKIRGKGKVSLQAAFQEAGALQTLIRWAMRRNLIQTCKFRGLDEPVKRKRRTRAYTSEEIDAVLDAARRIGCREIFTVVSIMRGCGVRPIELLRLRWQNVDLEKGVMYMSADMVKNGRPRKVALLSEGREALRLMLRDPLPEFVFAGRFPHKPICQTTLGKQWRASAEVAQIAPNEDGSPPELYSCKHTLATYLSRQLEFAPQKLATVMGWACVSEADTYVQEREEDVLQAAAEIESARAQAMPMRRSIAPRKPAKQAPSGPSSSARKVRQR